MDLPLNVHLLTLERLDHTHHLLRLEHQYPINEAPLNTTANVTLEVSLFLDIFSLSFHHLFKLTVTMHGSNLKGRLYKLDNLHTVYIRVFFAVCYNHLRNPFSVLLSLKRLW